MIHENTGKLLELLGEGASQEELHALDDLEMGDNRGKLLTAYAEYQAARETFERESRLRTKEIASGQELLEAETAFKQAREGFRAAMDTIRYETLIAHSQAAQDLQLAEFEAAAAEKRLRLKGADAGTVAALRALVPDPTNLNPCACGDPACTNGGMTSVQAALSNDDRFAFYALRAPISGFVSEKHLSLGEKVTTEESVFTVADASTVWVRFNVYQKDLATVRAGQKARVRVAGTEEREGVVAWVSPLIDDSTRTAQARIVMKNGDGALRPGEFVTVHAETEARTAPVVIPQSAVQTLDEKSVVFIESGDGFEAAPVLLGPSDRRGVVVLSGLEPGQRFVENGGFELKAKIVTSGLGAHAGHGH